MFVSLLKKSVAATTKKREDETRKKKKIIFPFSFCFEDQDDEFHVFRCSFRSRLWGKKEALLSVEMLLFFLPFDHKKKEGKKRAPTPSPVCWYLCLRMPSTAAAVPALVLLPAEWFYTLRGQPVPIRRCPPPPPHAICTSAHH